MTWYPIDKAAVTALVTALASTIASGCVKEPMVASPQVAGGYNAARCKSAVRIGRFAPSADLLVANFDNKPDTDDLHTIAGLATMLRDPRFSCVRVVATTGAYGAKSPEPFIHADKLMTMAFSKNWADAHSDRGAATKFLVDHALTTLRSGGHIWIMEAGMSDLTSDAVRLIAEIAPEIDLRRQVHLVQHSWVNEYLTDPNALNYVREHTSYVRVSDGNIRGNGTPGFMTKNNAAWPILLASKRAGDVWMEARQLANLSNPASSHPNAAIGAGGLDFSDLSAGAYIFGFEDLAGVEEFAAEFAGPPGQTDTSR